MTYLLGIALAGDIRTRVGALGDLHFKKGDYFYVGSAKKGLRPRIARHLSRNKKIFWHIDYLLSSQRAEIKKIWVSVRLKECEIAKKMQSMSCGFIDKFGSSDCQCKSHLFFLRKDLRRLKVFLEKII